MVYVPFDRGSIMNSLLDIKVRVTGVVREIVARNGITYKVLAVDEVTPMTAEYGATTIERGKAAGLPGTDLAEVHAYHDRTCYFYPRYAVVESLAGYSDGHVLKAWPTRWRIRRTRSASWPRGGPLFEIPNGGDGLCRLVGRHAVRGQRRGGRPARAHGGQSGGPEADPGRHGDPGGQGGFGKSGL